MKSSDKNLLSMPKQKGKAMLQSQSIPAQLGTIVLDLLGLSPLCDEDASAMVAVADRLAMLDQAHPELAIRGRVQDALLQENPLPCIIELLSELRSTH